MNAPAPFILISCRCSGAPLLHTLLAPHVPWVEVGSEPFRPGRPLEAVAQLFEADPDAARDHLRAELRRGLFFLHAHDTETRAFNAMLLEALAEAGYGVVHFVREYDVERLFTLLLGQQCHAWHKDELAALRERLVQGQPAPPISEVALRHMVRRERASRDAIAPLLASHPRCHSVSYEALTRSGLAALDTLDTLWQRLGLGERRARLDDATLLRTLMQAEDHAAGLRQYAAPLAHAWALIESEAHATILNSAPTPYGAADQQPFEGQTDENA